MIALFCFYSCKQQIENLNSSPHVIQLNTSMNSGLPTNPVIPDGFYLAGHRGFSAYYPENTISSFLRAIDVGVDILELDVCISKDSKVVVSHDLYMSSDFSNKEDGSPVKKVEENNYILYQMLYEDIKKFDVGSRTTSYSTIRNLYPEYKPLLSEVFEKCEKYILDNNKRSVIYLIELKSNRFPEGKWQPASTDEYCKLVNDVIKTIDSKKIIINSFDGVLLNKWHQNQELGILENIPLGYIVNDTTVTAETFIKRLGFRPELFEPYYNYKSLKNDIDYCHSIDSKIFTWTVNDSNSMKLLKNINVDGIITDFPNTYFKNFPR